MHRAGDSLSSTRCVHENSGQPIPYIQGLLISIALMLSLYGEILGWATVGIRRQTLYIEGTGSFFSSLPLGEELVPQAVGLISLTVVIHMRLDKRWAAF